MVSMESAVAGFQSERRLSENWPNENEPVTSPFRNALEMAESLPNWNNSSNGLRSPDEHAFQLRVYATSLESTSCSPTKRARVTEFASSLLASNSSTPMRTLSSGWLHVAAKLADQQAKGDRSMPSPSASVASRPSTDSPSPVNGDGFVIDDNPDTNFNCFEFIDNETLYPEPVVATPNRYTLELFVQQLVSLQDEIFNCIPKSGRFSRDSPSTVRRAKTHFDAFKSALQMQVALISRAASSLGEKSLHDFQKQVNGVVNGMPDFGVRGNLLINQFKKDCRAALNHLNSC